MAIAAAMPTKLAYRWMRGPIGWQASPAGPARLNDCTPEEPSDYKTLEVESEPFCAPEDGTTEVELAILPDQAAVENEANEWAALWQEKLLYNDPGIQPREEHFLEMLPKAVKEASESFPINTALGCDNMAP